MFVAVYKDTLVFMSGYLEHELSANYDRGEIETHEWRLVALINYSIEARLLVFAVRLPD